MIENCAIYCIIYGMEINVKYQLFNKIYQMNENGTSKKKKSKQSSKDAEKKNLNLN
jgi:hypothetical protein